MCGSQGETALLQFFLTLSCSKRLSRYSARESGLVRSGRSLWSRYLPAQPHPSANAVPTLQLNVHNTVS